MGLQQFQRSTAYNLITPYVGDAGKSDPEYSSILGNECSMGTDHFTEGIHKAGSIPAGKYHFDSVIYKRPDSIDRTGIYPAGRIRDRPVNICQDCF